MTDEERQQAEAYLKLQDNVNELIDERARVVLMHWVNDTNYRTIVKNIIGDEIRTNPMGTLASAITGHVRLLNRENIK